MALDLPTLLLAHIWVLAALTVTIGAMWKIIGKPALKQWLYSDFSALTGLVAIYAILMEPSRFNMFMFAASTWFTMYFRVLAIGSKQFVRPFKKVALVAFAALVAINLVLGAPHIAVRTFINSIAFAILAGSLVYVLAIDAAGKNRFGLFLILLTALAYMSFALMRAVYVTLVEGDAIFAATTFNSITSSVGILLGVLAHVGYIILVFDELYEAETDAAKTAIREAEQRRHAEEREAESRLAAEEQKRLLEVLTHEVRQPLNNASAALQSINVELTGQPENAQSEPIKRAHAVIDKVSTALSNALVAATILERRQQFKPVRCEPMLFVDMVVLDFNGAERERILVERDHAPLYVTADPILLRIALRNLIDNALRYSPADSNVIVRVRENETELGAEFSVENVELDEGWMDGVNVFERRVRGHAPNTTGSGMGLFITSEIAKIHQGWVKTQHKDGRRTFTVFLSD